MSAECIAENIPPGYKKTEVGVIPDDWETVKLSQVSAFITKGSTPTTYGFKWEDSGVLFLRSECVSEFGLDLKQSMFISEAANSLLRRSEVSDGDILITITGNVGRVILLTGINHANINQHIARVRIISPDIVPSYVFHFLSQPSIRNQFNTITTGQAYPQISLKQVREAEISIPPTKAEQEAIAEALSGTDAFIESLEQLIAKKRQIKQGAMQELMTGKRRLPGFGGEWIECSLRDCLLANPDYGINAPGVPDSGLLPTYLRITDIDDDGRFMPGNQVAVNHPLAMNYLLGRNEIVFARTGASVGKTYLYNIKDGELVFAGFLIRARINCEKLCPEFFAAFTKTSKYWNWVRMMSMRSGQPGINGNEFASLDLHLPPTLEEQSTIATILSDMDSEITALEEKLAKARQIKQGMMQELLTGKIRLI